MKSLITRRHIMFVLLFSLLATAAAAGLAAGNPPVAASPDAVASPDGDWYYSYIPQVPAGDPRFVMPMDTTLPWGAIGYLDNACSATLIDSWHILAAAHCFTFDNTGQWQEPLYFFPNYHPDRPNPPYVKVVRAVVGSRVDTGGIYLNSDWGIGFLEEQVTAYPSMQLGSAHPATWPDSVLFAGYARDKKWFPDAPLPQPVVDPPKPGGFCPNFGGPNGNCWWTPALVDDDCTVLYDTNDNLVLQLASCPIMGGNSGSPVVRNLGSDTNPVYRVAGVIHGGGYGEGSAPGTARFDFAPRFAAATAVATRDDGGPFAQVFVSDPDADFIARREREEESVTGAFGNYAPIFEVPDPGRLTAFMQLEKRPQVVLISGSTELQTSYVDGSGFWVPFSELDGPPGVTAFRDIDSAYDTQGDPQLYLVGSDGNAYTRRKEAADPLEWRPWELLSDADQFTRITAVRRFDGSQQAFLYTADGEVFSTYQVNADPDSEWTPAGPFQHAGDLPQLEDLDVSLRDDGGLQLFGVAQADGSLWTRGTFGPEPGSGWSLVWSGWDVPLFTPLVNTDQYIDDLATLTADLWPEEDGADLMPVVLATDSRGNVYITTYTNEAGWARWRSFYD